MAVHLIYLTKALAPQRLNMFEHHNKYTRTSYWLLSISSLAGFLIMGMFLPSLGGEQPVLIYGIEILLSIMLLLNTYFAYRIFKKSTRALKLCLWLYGLQIIGFETENWALSLNFGMDASLTWSYESTNITFNLLAIIIWFAVFKALRSVTKANNLLEGDGDKAASL